MKKYLALSFILTVSLASYSQILNDEEYTKEFTWGVNKNTNSGLIGGAVFKFARMRSENTFETYGLELINVRHPKEYRRLGQSGTYFVWGKSNFLYSIRTLYGREHLMFKKAPQQGVQISAIYAGGLTMGLIAPYYVLVGNNSYRKFDPSLINSPDHIFGSGKLFQGLGESKVLPGANVKAGLSFEFGAFKNNVAGVETGVALEAFPQKVIIIPTEENRAVFSSLYFSLYWGTRR